MSGSRPTLKEIMRVTGLSRATVDRALHGRPGVRRETETVVGEAISLLSRDPIPAAMKAMRPKVKASKRFCLVVQAGDAFTQSMLETVDRLATRLREMDCALQTVACVCSPDDEVAEVIRAQLGSDGLIVISKNAQSIVDATAGLRDRGVPVVASHTDLDQHARNVYVGIDNRIAGQTAGFLMGRHIGAERDACVAVMIETMSYRCHEEREMGFRIVLRQRFPRLKMLDLVKSDDSAATSYKAVKELLARHPEVEGIYNTAGGNQGVAQALREASKAEDMIFITHECNHVTEPLLRRGEIDYLITQNLEQMILRAVEQLLKILAGTQYEPQITVPVELLCPYSLPSV